MKSVASKTVCLVVSALILVIVLALNIAVGVMRDTVDGWLVGYKGGESSSASRAEGEELADQIQQEGTVLVRNENNTLPLSKDKVPQVNVFGWAASHWIYSGSGSGQVTKPTGGEFVGLLEALTSYGVDYNQNLTKMYNSFQSNREYTAALSSFNFQFSRLYEPKIDDETYYSAALKEEALSYSDTAIVVLGRVTGESNDAPKKQYKRSTKGSGNPEVDETRTYLEISTEEEALLTYVGQNYKNVIVLINSTSVMELGFLEDIEGIDACLIVASTGTHGATAIPKILYGEYSPTGKTADTFAYDLSTSSTYVNTGAGVTANAGNGETTTNMYTNSRGLYPMTVKHTNGNPSSVDYAGVSYTDYAEGIYLGYKWYETADAEGFWSSAKAKEQWGVSGYDDVVQFPFGFGLSYTTFEWEVNRAYTVNNSTVKEGDEIRFQVTITNTGNLPGQDVVEVYYTAPYTKGGIEKSAVNLAAFAKTTQVLKPGETETVEVAFNVEDMKSYDYNDANKNGFSGYELEAGDYTVTLRTDSHTLATDKIKEGSATYTYRIADDIKIRTDSASGNEVKNRFTGNETADGVAIDGNSDGNADITYLSRADIVTTFPYAQAANREMTDAVKALNLYTAAMANDWVDPDDEPVYFGTAADHDAVTVYEDGKITELGLRLGDPANYDSDEWDAVLDSLDLEQAQNVVLHGYIHTRKLDAIGKPETVDLDGPNQIGSWNPPGGTTVKTGFSSIVLAQTWNVELAYNLGLTLAKNAASTNVSGWYGPALNLHRSPFGGRNFEYYSEDAYLSGMMSAYAVAAAKNAGVFSYLKHLCLYESESGRDGMYNWLTEQALRETYIKPFEIAVKTHEIKNGDGTVIRTVGGAGGIMTSYGRIGAVWTGGSYALLTEVVRDEWGFKGAILTDYADHQNFMNGDQMLRAGGDLWMDGVSQGSFKMETSSNSFRKALREANKHVIFMWLNALTVNHSYNADADNTPIITKPAELNFRWYVPVLIAIDVIAVAGCGTWIFFTFRKKKNA